MIDISLEAFQAAREILKGKALATPLVRFQHDKNQIFLKAESLQPSGSFKIRGATYSMSQLSPEQKKRGVIAYSTGNHAQAVAQAAALMKVPAIIVMSPDVPELKIEGTRKWGAEVILVEPNKRRSFAEEMAEKKDLFLISPYDHPFVVTAQGTIGLEILDEMTPSIVYVPIGGGGLISGIAMAIKKSSSSVRVIGVEPELENDALRSFKTGKRVSMPGPSSSMADAIKIPELGDINFPIVRKYVDDIVTVSENQIAEATIRSAQEAHLFVEPAGALALAAALQYEKKESKPIVCIASGGNTSLPYLCKLCSK